MQTSEQELIREANETGFRPEILEKVWNLMAILDGISVHPVLKDCQTLFQSYHLLSLLQTFFLFVSSLTTSGKDIRSFFDEPTHIIGFMLMIRLQFSLSPKLGITASDYFPYFILCTLGLCVSKSL